MKKVLSIRAEETTQEGLRKLAQIREVAIGDLLDALVKEELGRLKRNVGALLKAEQMKPEKEYQRADAEELESDEPEMEERKASGSNKKNKKKKKRR